MPIQRYHWVVRPEGENHLAAYPNTDGATIFLRYHGDVEPGFWEVRDSEHPMRFLDIHTLTYHEAVMTAERLIAKREVA